ncbi:MAG: acetylxylan esterase [Planctomycetales bacterium]|nr:acetylxylan esterase [Planctomycetales bacterium]
MYESGARPNDTRLEPLKDLNGYFPFEVPASVEAWQARADDLRLRVKVACGLWPMPKSTPLNAVIHGRVERPGFTVEKVYFESYPGLYVTGLLFRPDDGKQDVKRPAVLCPHGHGGRLQDYGPSKIREMIAEGAERFESSGRFPKVARCGQLARMGCVVLLYDMLGYADSTQISFDLAHRFAKQRPELEGSEHLGLFSAQAELRLQSVFGIQAYHSIRALDFLENLPDVDTSRIAVTGGSGGGTQTIIVCAIDPRPVAAFPQGMVSTSMQGGCTCENACLLRIGTGNVELAALFAPKPQAMTAANDWTKEMMTKGYPQLRQLYGMLGAEGNVECRPLLHFPHNYNYVTRAAMYTWMNKHLKLGLAEPIVEEEFELLTNAEHAVWDSAHPEPAGGDEFERRLTKYLAEESERQLAAIAPRDADTLVAYRQVVGSAWRTLIGRGVPSASEIERTKVDKQSHDGFIYFEDVVRLKSQGEELPVISLYPTDKPFQGDVLLWLDGQGKQGLFSSSGELIAEVRSVLAAGVAVVSADLFGQGEFRDESGGGIPLVVANPRESAAYTFGYNPTHYACRVHDALTLIGWMRAYDEPPRRLSVLGVRGAGPVALAAAVVAGKAVARVAANVDSFRFAEIRDYRDENFLPGAVKYGGLAGLCALRAPGELWIGDGNSQLEAFAGRAYQGVGAAGNLQTEQGENRLDQAVAWLLRP